MLNPFEDIINLLKQQSISYELLEHKPVYTSEEAASVRGMDLHSGAKSLVLKAGKEFVLAILPGDTRVDSKKLKEVFGVKDLRFATPEEVQEIMGCAIGSCHPIPSIANLRAVLDPSLSENEYIFFNPGVHNKSIKMKYTDYLAISKPQIAEITQ
jgi:Ala-tRNA(Pro) deacylase